MHALLYDDENFGTGFEPLQTIVVAEFSMQYLEIKQQFYHDRYTYTCVVSALLLIYTLTADVAV